MDQRCTKLIIFLGTPHRGSTAAEWGKIASNLARLALQDTNKNIIRTLEVNSEVLDNIHENFKPIVQKKGIKIHSFQEAKGISGMKGADGKVSYLVSLSLGSQYTNSSMTAGCRRLLLEIRFATSTRDGRDHRRKPYADGKMQGPE